MVTPLEFWEEAEAHLPDFSSATLAKLEAHIGISLPTALVDLLRIKNGGYVGPFEFVLAGLQLERREEVFGDAILVNELYGIADESGMDLGKRLSLFDSPALIEEWQLPSGLVLLGGDGHVWYALDARAEDRLPVVAVDADSAQVLQLTETFESFLEALAPERTFDNDGGPLGPGPLQGWQRKPHKWPNDCWVVELDHGLVRKNVRIPESWSIEDIAETDECLVVALADGRRLEIPKARMNDLQFSMAGKPLDDVQLDAHWLSFAR